MRERDPWKEAERRFGLEVLMLPLPSETGGAALRRIDGRSWIIVDPTLSPVDQRCRLAHELVHLDRGTSWRCTFMPSTWDDCITSEERHVDQEVAAWLVPDEDIWCLVSDLVAAGEDVTDRVIASEFEVTRSLARLALRRFAQQGHGFKLAG